MAVKDERKKGSLVVKHSYKAFLSECKDGVFCKKTRDRAAPYPTQPRLFWNAWGRKSLWLMGDPGHKTRLVAVDGWRKAWLGCEPARPESQGYGVSGAGGRFWR